MRPLRLVFVALAQAVWVLTKATSRKVRTNLITIPATACIGVSRGLPLCLFLRSVGSD